jgi:PBSX family phage terminase large subunit
LTTLKLSSLITPKFVDPWGAKEPIIVLKGGRSSGKSTMTGLKIVLLLMKEQCDALIVRKVGVTLRDSVFAQILEAIDWLGASAKFRITYNPLEIKYTPTGQRMIFRGADKPEKLKSIKTKNRIGILWIEELADFNLFEDVEMILNSVIRAEGFYKVFFTYNPPKRKGNWVNKMFETNLSVANTYIHHSTSFDNPFQSKLFLERAEAWRQKDPHFFSWNYEGTPIGGGVMPFSNLEFRAITNEEISLFDNIKCGLDWGYSVDPLAYVRCHYDKKYRILYIFGEIYGIKLHNYNVSTQLKKHNWTDLIVADSSEPRSIQDLGSYGFKVVGARKGQGSVEWGLEWLDSLSKIIIDPVRCPNTTREFEQADYAIDRNGETIPRLSGEDHAIDAVRYATEDIQLNRQEFYPDSVKNWQYNNDNPKIWKPSKEGYK